MVVTTASSGTCYFDVYFSFEVRLQSKLLPLLVHEPQIHDGQHVCRVCLAALFPKENRLPQVRQVGVAVSCILTQVFATSWWWWCLQNVRYFACGFGRIWCTLSNVMPLMGTRSCLQHTSVLAFD